MRPERMLPLLSLLIGLVVCSHAVAGEEAEDPKVAALKSARLKWLTEQVTFIEKLGSEGYEDLAKKVQDQTLRGQGSPDGQALDAEEKKALNRAQAKAKLEAALRLTDLREKVKLADEAVAAMKQVVSALPQKSPLRLQAEEDLAEMYMKLGGSLTEEYTKVDKEGEAEQAKEIDKSIAEVEKKLKPLADKDKKLEKEYTEIVKKLGKEKDAANKKKLMAERTAKARERAELAKTGEPLQEDLKKLQEAKGNMVGATLIGGKAKEYFTAGLAAAVPVYKALDEDFWNKLGALDEAEGRKERREAMTRLRASFGHKISFSHKVEDAHATRLLLYERGSPDHQAAVKEADKFIDTVRGDYEQYLPSDKWIYIQWIRVLSHQNTDVDKPQTEEEADPEMFKGMEKEEIREAKADVLHYLWPTTRMRFLWDYHFSTKLDSLKPKDRRGPEFRATEDAKVRGMYYYAISLMRSARGHYALADREPNATRKKKILALADRLMKDAGDWVDECVKSTSRVGRVPQVVRLSARLKIKTEYHLLRAERLMKAGKKDEAKEEVKKALEEPSKVMMEGGARWRHVVQERIRLVAAKGRRIVGEDAADVGRGPVQILAEADALYQDAIKEGAFTRKRELFDKAKNLYLEVIGIANDYREREKRAAWMPRTLFRAGICAWQAEDYLTGYIVNFALAREFASDNYPEEAFASAREYAGRALGNLHACAGKLLDQDEKDEARRELYAEQLFLRMERDPNPDPRLVVKLIDTLKNLKMYNQALALIGDVPEEHLYYRMAILLAADIHQTIMKKAQKVCDKIRQRAEKKERELTDEEKAAIAEQEPIIAAHSAEAERFANIFREAVEKRPAPITDAQKKVYRQEDAAIPGALMIPISNQFARKEFAKALVGIADYIAKVQALNNLSDEAKYRYVALARWLELLCVYNNVDHKTAKIDAVAAAIGKAQEKLTALREVEQKANEAMLKAQKAAPAAEAEDEEDKSKQTIKREDNTPKAYMQLASGWNNLANRVLRERLKKGEENLAAEDQKIYDDYRKRAADLFRKTESIAYGRRGIGMHIAKTYFELGMYKDAADMYDKVIKYWAEALFTPDYLFQEGKSLADLKAYEIPAAIKSQLGGVLTPGEVQAAADNDKLLEVLNKAIKTIDYAKNKEKIDTILKTAKETYRDDRDLQKGLDQAQALAQRDDLAREMELRQKLNRYVIEAVYPTILARSKPIPLLPTPNAFDATLRTFGAAYPPTGEGPKKAVVLKYIHNQDLVRLDRDKKLLKAYQADLKKRYDEAVKKRDGKLIGMLGGFQWLFEEGLKMYIYGVEEKGRVLKRSYYRARQQIATMIAFDKHEIKLDSPKYMPTNKPKDSFLMHIDEALEFNGSVLSAKRRYALALVKLKKNDEALRYLEELVNFWPGEIELRIDLAETHAAVGDNKAEKEFTQDAANHFIYAQIAAKKIADKSKRGTKIWWQAQKAMRYAQYLEVIARKRCKADKVNYSTKVKIPYRGEIREVAKKTPPELEKEAKMVVNDVVRMIWLRPPDDIREAFEDMLAGLKEEGYKIPSLERKKLDVPKDDEVEDMEGEKDKTQDVKKEDGKDEKKADTKDGKTEEKKPADPPEEKKDAKKPAA